MLHMHNSRSHIKHLLAPTLALLGLTSWLMLRETALRPPPRDSGATAQLSTMAGQANSVSTSSLPDDATRARVQEAYGRLPLSFEVNRAQTNAQVKFLARGSGSTLFLTPTEAVLVLTQTQGRGLAAERNRASEVRSPQSAVLRMKLVGANASPQVVGVDQLAGESNYFIGNDPQQWRTSIPHYRKVRYEKVYPGVDLVYYGNQRQLEYDFVVAAGADPRCIKLSFSGAEHVLIDESGDLVVQVVGGEIRQHKPVVYQEVGDVRKEIASHYVLPRDPHSGLRTRDSYEVGIAVGSYDVSRELVIDPVLDFSTYLGGGDGAFRGDFGRGIAVDLKGSAYVTGFTSSTDFPTKDAFQPAIAGGEDAFVVKIGERRPASSHWLRRLARPSHAQREEE
jgi:hypothetical protein